MLAPMDKVVRPPCRAVSAACGIIGVYGDADWVEQAFQEAEIKARCLFHYVERTLISPL